MKLLWFSHFVPYPPRGGHLQRSFNLIRQISNSYEVSLLALNFLGGPAQQVQEYSSELKKYCESVEIWELPYPWRGGRWWAELLWSPLFRAPFSCRVLFSKQILSRWEQTLRQHPGALVHLDSIDLALFASAANGFRKVLNHHNCESAMAYRRAQKEPNPLNRAYLWLQAHKLACMERSICGAFDVNTVVSEQDFHLLQAIEPSAHIHIVENGVDTHYFVPSSTEEEPHSLVFTGSLDWYPNVSAVGFFVREIWPRVKGRFPGARLYVAGKNPPEHALRWMKEDSNILVISNPDDMRPLLARAAVFICPMLEGGGTRLKILDAMAMARSVVSTTIGCEGLRVKHLENIFVADAPQEFADGVMQLLENKELRHQLGNAGRGLVEGEYSWERIGQQLELAYRCALQAGMCDQREQRRGQTTSIASSTPIA